MWAASFKSLYQKRPSKTMRLRTDAWRGAPDTALRHVGTDLSRSEWPLPNCCPSSNFRVAGNPPGTREIQRSIATSRSNSLYSRDSGGSWNARIGQGQNGYVIVLSK